MNNHRMTEPYGFIEETEYDSLRNQFEDACKAGDGTSVEGGSLDLSPLALPAA